MTPVSSQSRLRFAVVVIIGVIVASVFSYFWWRSTATLLPWTKASPDGRYRIEYYRVWTPSRLFPTMPGQSSDNIDGFVRLYDADGKLLGEVFRTFLVSQEPRWNDDEVYSLGDDPFCWKLSHSP